MSEASGLCWAASCIFTVIFNIFFFGGGAIKNWIHYSTSCPTSTAQDRCVGTVTLLSCTGEELHRDTRLVLSSQRPLVPGPTQPPIRWIPGALSPGVKHPSSAEVKAALCYISTPCAFVACDNFTFTSPFENI
jgi:hypothetical protein